MAFCIPIGFSTFAILAHPWTVTTWHHCKRIRESALWNLWLTVSPCHRTGFPWWTNMHCAQLHSSACRRLPAKFSRQIQTCSWCSWSTTMLSNFDCLDLKILVVLFQAHEGKETRKSCSVRLAMADRSCICCDRIVMCHISVIREKSAETSLYFHRRKCSC